MIGRLSSFVRDTAGSVTIELALLAPILGTMLIGMVDLSTAFSHKLRLEQIAQRTIERVQQNGFTVAQEAALELEAETAAGTGSVATLTWWLECDGVRQTGASAYTNGCSSATAVIGRFIELAIVKSHSPIIAARFTQSNANGTITVRGTAGIRIQ